MSVPPEDMLCRFISGHKDKWSSNNNRPRPPAFKENGGISVWNLLALQQHGVDPESLLIESLEGHGQAHHTAGDYLGTALKAEKTKGVPLGILVEWRPEDLYVKEPWRLWAYAHAQVECSADDESVLVFLRQMLSKNARRIIPPGRVS
jgi:hypothetical protein